MSFQDIASVRTPLSPSVRRNRGGRMWSPQVRKLYHHQDAAHTAAVPVSRSLGNTCSPAQQSAKRGTTNRRTSRKRAGENAAPGGTRAKAGKRGKQASGKTRAKPAARRRSKTPSRGVQQRKRSTSASSAHTPAATARAKALLAHTAAVSAATPRGTAASARTHTYHTPKRGRHRALVEPHSGSTAATCTPGSTPGQLTPGSVKEVRGVAAYLRRMRGGKPPATPGSVVLSPASCASAATPHSARSNRSVKSARSGRSVRSGGGRALWRAALTPSHHASPCTTTQPAAAVSSTARRAGGPRVTLLSDAWSVETPCPQSDASGCSDTRDTDAPQPGYPQHDAPSDIRRAVKRLPRSARVRERRATRASLAAHPCRQARRVPSASGERTKWHQRREPVPMAKAAGVAVGFEPIVEGDNEENLPRVTEVVFGGKWYDRHAAYRVTRNPEDPFSGVMRRFSEFRRLYLTLQSKFAHCPHDFPSRTIFPLRRNVVTHRRRELQRFLKAVFTDAAMGSTLEAKRFLGEIGNP